MKRKDAYVSTYSFFFCALSDIMCFRMLCPWTWKSNFFAESSSFSGGPNGKESACNKGDWVQSLDQEDPLEKGTAIHSSILAWRIPRTEEPGRLQSMESERVAMTDQQYWPLKKEFKKKKKEFFISPFAILFFRLQPKCNTACLTEI